MTERTRILHPALLTALLVSCGEADPTGGEHTVATADGATIAYDVRGSGSPALVFVHCWACNRAFWREQLDVFAADHTVLALDLPGHGASGRDRASWTLDAYADDVVRVVDDAGLDEVVLIGHSMGGPVSLLAAARLGERARGVVCVDELHDAAYTWPEDAVDQWIAGFEADYGGAMRAGMAGMVPGDTVLRAWIVEQALAADTQAMLALVPQFPAFNLSEALSAVEAPVRCINAEPYGEFSMATAVATQPRYGDFEPVLMDGVGHFLHLERPAAFNEHLRTVLAGLSGGTE